MARLRQAAVASLAAMLLGGAPSWAPAQGGRDISATPAASAASGAGQRADAEQRYPKQGESVAVLPSGSTAVLFRAHNLFVHDGVWFRPEGHRFVVTGPPAGVVVPMLPPGCATVWSAGKPYCLANGVYYAALAGEGYRVVAAPLQAPTGSPSPSAQADTAGSEPLAKTSDTIEVVRRACETWARSQPLAPSDDTVFQVAFVECMDARGHPVR